MAKKRQYTFLKKKETPEGRLSLILSSLSALFMAALFLLSLAFDGRANVMIGAGAMAGSLLAAYSFYLGIRGLSRGETERRLPTVSAIWSGVVTLVWMALFFAGLRG